MHSTKPIVCPGLITVPNGKQSIIEHIGLVKLNSLLASHNVLRVPAVHFDLPSVSKLRKQHTMGSYAEKR